MKSLISLATVIGVSLLGNVTNAYSWVPPKDPTPTSVEAKCLSVTSVSAPLLDPNKALTVFSTVNLFCTISLVDARYHPETKLYYYVDEFGMYNRANDFSPFKLKRRNFKSSKWKVMRKAGSTIFLANEEIERSVRPSRGKWQWQARAKVTFRITAMDHENHRPIRDEKSTGLIVSQISELKVR